MPNLSAADRFDPLVDRLEAAISARAAAQSSRVDTDRPLTHRRTEPARPARLAEHEPAIDHLVRERLGVPRLWSHQADALTAVLDGRSVVLTTGTSSGKSLVFQAAVGDACAKDRPATALAIHPTKALGHDQLRKLDALGFDGVIAGAYDGDATDTERNWVRRHANVIYTNPDMLHAGILPRHGQWATFLRRLRFVFIDETHTLRGTFGGHVAHVLRRLRRLCAALGAEPVFVFASATVGDAAVLCANLAGLEAVEVVEADGSPRGERLIVQVDPPLLDEETGARLSSHLVTATLAAELIEAGHRTIVFTPSRRLTETLTSAIRSRLDDEAGRRVQAYRAGYLADERRAIEASLSDGTLRGVVATNALELGIDIGGLDACVVHGFPGTISSFRQQIGRVGRGSASSLAALVAGQDQLDRYLLSHPDELLTRRPEPVVINPWNPNLIDPQLCCAAAESPLVPDDARYWGDDLDDAIHRCVLADRLRIQRTDNGDMASRRAVSAGHGHPARTFSLRSGSGHEVHIVDTAGQLIGTVDASRATSTLYPGASYLHRTEPYRVLELDYDERRAVVEPDDGTTTTRADTSTELDILGCDRHRELGAARLEVGPVAVRTLVTGYSRSDLATGTVVDRVPLTLPAESLVTTASILSIPDRTLAASNVGIDAVPGTLHALEHALISMLPLFALCDRWDVGGLSLAWHPHTGAATIAIYDGYPGGSGIAELTFATAQRHLPATLAMLESCSCRTGCPSCVQSPKCGNGNDPLDKHGAISLLEYLLAPDGS